MWIDERKYNQFIDFDSFSKSLEEIKEYDLADLKDYPEGCLEFFQDLSKAQTTSDMEKYSTDDLLQNAERLYQCFKLLETVSGFIEDDSILGDSKKFLDAMEIRKLKAVRRVL